MCYGARSDEMGKGQSCLAMFALGLASRRLKPYGSFLGERTLSPIKGYAGSGGRLMWLYQ
jgi:hypothetical protein